MTTDVDPDAALLARIARNDAGAVRAMVAAKLPRLIALATRLLGDRQEAEDVAQEVFVRIWRIAPRWQAGRARFDTWLHQVALNRCRDRLRRRRDTVMADPPDRIDPGPGAEAVLIATQQGAAVARAIAALPDRQREAIVLQYYQDLSNAAAAQVMGIGVEAFESLLARARRGLRQAMRESQDDIRP